MTVLIGWIMGVDMDLNFHVYEVLAMIVSVHLVAEVVRGGTSQWLAGLCSLTTPTPLATCLPWNAALSVVLHHLVL